MKTTHRLIIGTCEDMSLIENGSIHLIIFSPPYFNTPFDYEEFIKIVLDPFI